MARAFGILMDLNIAQIGTDLENLNRPSASAVDKTVNRFVFTPLFFSLHDGFKHTWGKLPAGMIYPVVKTTKRVPNEGNVEGEEIIGIVNDRRGKPRYRDIAVYPGDFVPKVLMIDAAYGVKEITCLRTATYKDFQEINSIVNTNFMRGRSAMLTAEQYYDAVRPLYDIREALSFRGIGMDRAERLAALAQSIAEEILAAVEVARDWCTKWIAKRHQEMEDKTGKYDLAYSKRDYMALAFAGLTPKHDALDHLAMMMSRPKDDDSADKIIGALVKYGVIKPENAPVEEVAQPTEQQRNDALAKARAAKAAKRQQTQQAAEVGRADHDQQERLATELGATIQPNADFTFDE